MTMQNMLCIEFDLSPPEASFVLAIDLVILVLAKEPLLSTVVSAGTVNALFYPFEGNPKKKRDMLEALNYVNEYKLQQLEKEERNANITAEARSKHTTAGDNSARRLTASADPRVGGNPERSGESGESIAFSPGRSARGEARADEGTD